MVGGGREGREDDHRPALRVVRDVVDPGLAAGVVDGVGLRGGDRRAQRPDTRPVRLVQLPVAVGGVVDVDVAGLVGMRVGEAEVDRVLAVGFDLHVGRSFGTETSVRGALHVSAPSGCVAKVGLKFPPRQNR